MSTILRGRRVGALRCLMLNCGLRCLCLLLRQWALEEGTRALGPYSSRSSLCPEWSWALRTLRTWGELVSCLNGEVPVCALASPSLLTTASFPLQSGPAPSCQPTDKSQSSPLGNSSRRNDCEDMELLHQKGDFLSHTNGKSVKGWWPRTALIYAC